MSASPSFTAIAGKRNGAPVNAAVSRPTPPPDRQSGRLGVTSTSSIQSSSPREVTRSLPSGASAARRRMPSALSPIPSSFSEQSIPSESTPPPLRGGVALRPAGKRGPRRRKRRPDADRHVGSAAHHREVPVCRRHPADAVLIDRFHLPHHDAGEPADEGRRRGHLDAGVRQAIGDGFGGEVRRHVLLEPAVADFHANWVRKRRSFSKKRRMSSMPYLSMAIRSTPMPKAHPVTSSGS